MYQLQPRKFKGKRGKKGKKGKKRGKKGKKGKKEENFPPRRPRPEPPMGKKSLSQNNPMCERSEDWGVWRLKRFFSMMGALDLFFDCDSDARVRSALAALKLELSLFFYFFSRFLTNFHDFSWKTTPTHRLRTAHATPTHRPRTVIPLYGCRDRVGGQKYVKFPDFTMCTFCNRKNFAF